MIIFSEPAPHTARQCLWRVYAKRSILATGAIERPIVFGDNDRPGVMLAGAARTYANRYGVQAGKKVVVCGNNNDIARTVADLGAAGCTVEAIVDTRATNVLARRSRSPDLSQLGRASCFGRAMRSGRGDWRSRLRHRRRRKLTAMLSS